MPGPQLPSDEQLRTSLNGLLTTGLALAENAFAKEPSAERNGKMIGKIRAVADSSINQYEGTLRVIQEETGKQVAPRCGPGCSYCCSQVVGVAIPEVLAIADHCRTTYSAEEMASLRERLAEYRKAFTPDDPDRFRMPCPMLVDRLCSIHAVRPLVCRGYTSLSLDRCIEFQANPGTAFLANWTVKPLWLMALRLRQGLQFACLFRGLDADLVFFPIALERTLDDPQTAERFFAGERMFTDGKLPPGDEDLVSIAKRLFPRRTIPAAIG